MQTKLIPAYQVTEEGKEAEAILRSCVHCGFCNATCPSYQVLGNELDGPRGRIYLIKEILEGKPVTDETRKHLDLCLTCRACETTCPSGVQYHRLVDIGRELVKKHMPRSSVDKVQRKLLSELISRPALFKALIALGRAARPALPEALKEKVPVLKREKFQLPLEGAALKRRVLLLEGCVQDALVPSINDATRSVFLHMGVGVDTVKELDCCGSASFHLDEQERARELVKKNISLLYPYLQSGDYEALVVNASGCGVFVKDYPELFSKGSEEFKKASCISRFAKDPIEFLAKEDWSDQQMDFGSDTLVFHPPCTLQHGLKIVGRVEALLKARGANIVPFYESGLCCGSAGTYSILQKNVASQLRERKLSNITDANPDQILTANIGCQVHLAEKASVPVKHWLEYLAERMG